MGAGTLAHFRLAVGGRAREYAPRVAEPAPDRLPTESDLGTGSATSFTVTPDDDGSHVRVETTWPAARGLAGLVERFLAPRLLRHLDTDELARLDR